MHLTKTKWNGDPAADRDRFIGGSDMGTILGLNPFKSAYTLWAEKTGLVEVPDISDKLAVWFGTEEEEIVAKRFCFETGKKVKRSLMSYSCEEYPFLIGHIDRLIVGEDAGLECKTTSSFNKTDFESGEVPPAHYAQCQLYMFLTGKPLWYYAVKRDNREFYKTAIERNDEWIENVMLPAALNFWEHVQNKEPVIPDGSDSSSDTVSARFPADSVKDEEVSVNLSKGSNELIETLAELNNQIKELSNVKSEIENRIKDEMGTYQTANTGKFVVKWKSTSRTSVDTTRLKKERPDIYEHYSKVTENRRFSFKERKEEE